MDSMEKKMIGENIRRLRKMAGYNQEDIAAAVGIKQASVSRWETGQDVPEFQNLIILTNFLECSADDILSNKPSRQPIQAPLISWVQAGAFTECYDPYTKGDYENLVNVNTYDKPTVIALKVVGDSMNKFASHGSTIIVDYTEKELVDGRLYVIRLNGDDETTFKKYRADPQRLEPWSWSDEFETIFPKGQIDVVGRVVEVTHKAP